PPSLDLPVHTPNATTLFSADGTGHFTLAQTLTPTSPGNLAVGSGHIQMATALLTNDLFADLVTVSPGTNELLVYPGKGDGTFGTPDRYASGASQPVAVAVGDFLGDARADLAVGHRDGSVTFFEGLSDGHFQARPDLTVHGLGAVASLAAGDTNGDGGAELAVSTATGVTLLSNHHQPPVRPI